MASLTHPLYPLPYPDSHTSSRSSPKPPLLLYCYSITHHGPSFISPLSPTPTPLLLPHFSSTSLHLLSEAEAPTTAATETVVEELIRVARELPESASLGELLVGYGGKITTEDCVELLGRMGEDKGLVRCGLHLFEWMGLQKPSLVTPNACSVLFTVLGEAGMGDQVMVFFRNLRFHVSSEFSDVHLFNSAISALLCCKRYDKAWEVFEAVEANNVAPDHVTCSMMIAAMRECGRSAKECWEFFGSMNSKGVKWGPEVLGALVKSFCKEGLKKEALILQTEMEKKGIFADTHVYNTLMDAYCKSDQIEEAEGLFAEMTSKGLKPTSTTYNILIDAYSKRMHPEIIEELMVEMQEAGVEPNILSYTCLINAYGTHNNKSEMAENAFLRMREVGIMPDSHSYTALIHAYSVGGWHEKAWIAFVNMLKEGIKPSVETYTGLLDALRRAGDTKKLMIIWKMMSRERVEATEVTFNTVLDGFAKQGLYAEAKGVVFEFGKLGLKPTVITYNILMNAYARGGQDSKLPQLLNEMESINLKPDCITYTTMIYAYIRARDFKKAFFYYKQMVKSRQVPDAESYEKLRAMLTANAARSNTKDKKAIREIINVKFGGLYTRRRRMKDEFWKGRKKQVKEVRQPD